VVTLAFSLDTLLLSRNINSQNFCVVKPSVARAIFPSSTATSKLTPSLFLREGDGDDDLCTLATDSTDDNDVDGVTILAIDFLDRLAIYV
jgi:hypothetical protein